MSYGKFVKDLPNSLKRKIIAYDNLPNHAGCVLFVQGGPKRVELDLKVLEHDWGELADWLYEVVDRPSLSNALRVTLEKGQLTLIETPALSQAELLDELAEIA